MKVSTLTTVVPPMRRTTDLTEVFREVSVAEMGKGALVTCENAKEAASITSSLYSAYNKDHKFLKDRGYGVRVWKLNNTTLQVIKIKEQDVLEKKGMSEMMRGIDRVTASIEPSGGVKKRKKKV